MSPAEAEASLSHSIQHSSGHTWNTVQFWSPVCKTDVDVLERVQRRDSKMTQLLESLTYAGRLGLFSGK